MRWRGIHDVGRHLQFSVKTPDLLGRLVSLRPVATEILADILTERGVLGPIRTVGGKASKSSVGRTRTYNQPVNSRLLYH